MNLEQDTFIALSTPIGESAIAIIRANGPLVPSLIQSIFKEPAPTPRKVQTRNYTAICGNAIDYCSFTYFQTPHSYTGDDILEINCHGNPLIIQKIINDLLSRNCRLAQAGEFTRRAYENKKIDLTQAEAVQALIHAKNERALYLAKKQLEGSLGNYMQFIINELITCMAHIEASIDFSDEDLSTTQKAPLETLKEIKNKLNFLLKKHQQSLFTQKGIKTVIIGAPNAGKSTLLNGLLKHERAIVSPEAGTTRDYITEPITIGAYSLELIDTAGLRIDAKGIEKQGIQNTLTQSAEADLYLWVIDQSAPWPEIPDNVRTRFSPQNSLIILNKNDLKKHSDFENPQELAHYTIIETAIAHNSTEMIEKALIKLIETYFIPQSTDDFLINARHTNGIESAIDALEKALSSHSSPEFIASDIHEAIRSLEAIIGKIDQETILDKIFNTFCIGK